MKVLIKQATIICPSSPFHGQINDIFIAEGIIQKINPQLTDEADLIIDTPGLHVSLGWMDVFAQFSDPGAPHKETLVSGSAAAAAGGYTDVMIIPNTQPVIGTKSQVEYVVQKSSSLAVNIHPIAVVTNNGEGKSLSEMYDMYAGGAIAFSDGIHPIQDAGLLLKALQYVSAIGATIIQVPDDTSIRKGGLMNEGIMSTRLGLPGKPAISEELAIARDIELLAYTKSKLHLTGISTAKGVELIRRAKEQDLQISCSATPYHCYFNDEDLAGYDTNLKVNPPLRTRHDMLAIQQAVKDGVIDCLASHHIPEHWDDKTCEFEFAHPGMTGLESLFGVVNALSPGSHTLIEQLTTRPRKIFGLTVPEIKEGSPACLTFYNPFETYIFTKAMTRSVSANNAFVGKELTGKVIGIINQTKIAINNEKS